MPEELQNKTGLFINVYKGFVIHSNDLKFNPTELKKKPEEEKEKPETNSKDYDTIRKILKGTDKPTKNK